MQAKLVVANWKAELSPDAARSWLEVFLQGYRPVHGLWVVLAVPCLMLTEVGKQLQGRSGITLAAQTVSPYPPGRYTGALPAAWLSGLVEYVLVGHRERRHVFGEKTTEVAAQVRECRAAGLTPIVCLDRDNLAATRAALDTDDLDVVLPAWTPDSAVALESLPGQDDLARGVERVRGYFPGRPVLYGGGVTPENLDGLLSREDVYGVMLGQGCLDPSALADSLNSLSA